MSETRAAAALMFALGFAAGVGQLYDNSFLTHLATGRLIWDGAGFPRSDPYSFTALGEAWFPQSWFASVVYGGLDRAGGATALRFQAAVFTGALAVAGFALSRPAGHVLRRVLSVAPYLLLGIFGWTHRPYLFAFLCLAACLLVVQRQLPRWSLLPAGWVWLNTHGSWPLGLLALAVLWLGRRLDREDATREATALRWLMVGLVAGCFNPYGPRLLRFPLVAVERREVFVRIREWKPPTFDRPGQLAFLLVMAAAFVALRRAPSWRAALTMSVFVAAGLLSARNLPVAAMVLLPTTAEGLAGHGRPVPRLLVRAAPVLASAVLVVSAVVATRPPGFGESIYPVEAERRLSEQGLGPLDARWITQDFVGNWLGLRFGAHHHVFVDDRYEIIPTGVVEDYVRLVDGRPGWDDILTSYQAEVVVWQAERPLAQLLDASVCWEVVHRDDIFIAAVPTSGAGCPDR